MEKNASEIAKLTERISKDPRSKLFVPLAEEYKKAGDIEMAVSVLIKGLEQNPGYLTARSFLGRLLFEKGDLAKAQLELEEVVKAIPDNLLAQRKLGDIYTIQGKKTEALACYRVVMAISPKDAEVASFIKDLEAGVDISGGLSRPIMNNLPHDASAAPKSVPPQAGQVKSAPPAAPVKPAVPIPQPPAPVPVVTMEEEPEEVFFVEPLEEVLLDEVLTSSDNSGEPGNSGSESVPSSEVGSDVFALDHEVIDIREPESQAADEQLFPSEHETFSLSDNLPDRNFGAGSFEKEDFFAVESEPAATTEAFEESPFSLNTASKDSGQADSGFDETPIDLSSELPSFPALIDEASAAETLEADDFTTDTLAELYIAQGFYEKAIEIYERMTTEKPGSQALHDKLASVRAMAAGNGAAVMMDASAGTVKPGLDEPSPVVESPDWFSPSQEGGEQSSSSFSGIEESGLFQPDFQPQESKPEPASTYMPGTDNSVAFAPEAETSNRRETIERLESWLKNIMKER